MEDWLKCQISPLVKYRQNQNKTKTKYICNSISAHTIYQIRVAVYYCLVSQTSRDRHRLLDNFRLIQSTCACFIHVVVYLVGNLKTDNVVDTAFLWKIQPDETLYKVCYRIYISLGNILNDYISVENIKWIHQYINMTCHLK